MFRSSKYGTTGLKFIGYGTTNTDAGVGIGSKRKIGLKGGKGNELADRPLISRE